MVVSKRIEKMKEVKGISPEQCLEIMNVTLAILLLCNVIIIK